MAAPQGASLLFSSLQSEVVVQTILIAGVMYSPNLGDGVIAECLSACLASGPQPIASRWLDIAGRPTFSPPTRNSLRPRVLHLLERLPEGVSHQIARRLIERQVRQKLEPLLPSAFDGVSGVLIGGGQLLADTNLNFPLKLARVVGEAEARGLPFVIHGVGVSSHWSHAGREIFRSILGSRHLRFVSVRDEPSKQRLERHLADMHLALPLEIEVYPDAGIMATSRAARPADQRPRVGIGVIHPVAMEMHGDDVSTPTKTDLISRYIAIATALNASGIDVEFFTNGAGEDEDLLAQLVSQQRGATVWVQPRVSTARELIDLVASYDAVVSHRLHANIVAFACGVPSVGLRWDTKMNAFFALSNRSEFLLPGDLSNVPAVVQAVHDALSAGVEQQHQSVLSALSAEGAREAVTACLATSG